MKRLTPETETTARHQVTRIRRDPVRRTATIVSTEHLTPHMLRLWLEGPELVGFDSAGVDDHIKLLVTDDDGQQAMRDYTPRAFDSAAGTLVIDFALHEAGPATRWAMAAKPGDTARIAGPRGSAVLADDFDWYFLIGDETALPSIARRAETLRPDVPVTTLVVVDSDADRLPLIDRPGLQSHWVTREGGAGGDEQLLRSAIEKIGLPKDGEGYVWIAAEGSVARALRSFVLDTLGHPKEWTKAAGYWTQGAVGEHITITD